MAKRLVGATFIGLVCLTLWIAYAVFAKIFVRTVDVTIETSSIGLELHRHGEVKLRGILVGAVQGVGTDGHVAEIRIGLKPEMVELIPAGVSARILPKTLFGEKYVSLVPPPHGSGRPIRAGDVIPRDRSTVGTELERFNNDFVPLLRSLEPADLNATLYALSTALEGRGTTLGRTLVQLDAYLRKLNPQLPVLVADLRRLVTVVDLYADIAGDVIQLLRNSVRTGATVVDKEAALQRFFTDLTGLAGNADQVLEQDEDRLIRLGRVTRPTLDLVEWYSPTVPCWIRVMADNLPKINETFREGMLHINLQIVTNQPTAYGPSETPVWNERWADKYPPAVTKLFCVHKNFSYPKYPGPYTPDNPPPLIKTRDGVQGGHGKVREDEMVDPHEEAAQFGRSASSGYAGTPEEQRLVNAVLASASGVPADEIPDLATLMFGPLARGAAIDLTDGADR